jgi:hypothetical protein
MGLLDSQAVVFMVFAVCLKSPRLFDLAACRSFCPMLVDAYWIGLTPTPRVIIFHGPTLSGLQKAREKSVDIYNDIYTRRIVKFGYR